MYNSTGERQKIDVSCTLGDIAFADINEIRQDMNKRYQCIPCLDIQYIRDFINVSRTTINPCLEITRVLSYMIENGCMDQFWEETIQHKVKLP